MSILLVPLEKYKIPAGGSMDFDVNLDARKLPQESYKYNIPVLNNSPSGRNLKVPVTFNVSGTPEFATIDSVDFGEQLIVSGPKNKHTREFEIENTGTAHFRILKMEQALPETFKVDGYLQIKNPMTGELEWQWTPMFDGSSKVSNKTPILILAKQKAKFRVSFSPGIASTFTDQLILTTTVRTHPTDTISFFAKSLNPPVFLRYFSQPILKRGKQNLPNRRMICLTGFFRTKMQAKLK